MIVFIVLIGTAYDVYKRYINYLNCQEIVTHSTVLIENSTDELEHSADFVDDHSNIDFENLYLINLSRKFKTLKLFKKKVILKFFNSDEPVFFRILVTFSLYTNTKKIFKVEKKDIKNQQQLGCLHGIRVLSLCWVILGHS